MLADAARKRLAPRARSSFSAAGHGLVSGGDSEGTAEPRDAAWWAEMDATLGGVKCDVLSTACTAAGVRALSLQRRADLVVHPL